jgi:general L-amino acid transport system substrate-binding protein
MVKSVCNFDEIWNRNLGPTTKTAIPRGINNLWTKGGLLYAMPYR